jgi:hypothetical protein
MSEEEFNRFLELLSSSSGGADGCDRYLLLYRKLGGLFTMKGVNDPEEATAATITVACRKIAAGALVPDVGKYCMGIARNIAKERLRYQRREVAAFLKFIEDGHNGTAEQVARIDQILRPCFELLCEEDRELLADYCRVLRGRARAEHRREMAVRRKTTVLALRMQVTRLRKDLSDCVQLRTNGD